MQSTLTTIKNNTKDLSWIECVLFLTDAEQMNNELLSVWAERFSKITVAASCKRPVSLPEEICWHRYDQNKSRSDIWNHLLINSDEEWVLFLENDENVELQNLPEQSELSVDRWVPAFIFREKNGTIRNYYRIRLVPNIEENLFEGIDLPDCAGYITRNDIQLSDQPLVIERKSDGNEDLDVLQEMSVKEASPQVYLIQGETFLKKRKYVLAAAQYRKLLKAEKLLPFDRLAAVNGLARCFTEQYKWPKALQLTKNSIEAEKVQWFPYLIQFRIFQLQKEWKKAFNVLEEYYSHINSRSIANFDKAMNRRDTLKHLGDLAMKAGFKKKAFSYFQELYSDTTAKLNDNINHKLLMLSIELADRENAIFYFNNLFEDVLPDDIETDEINELHDYMTLFMKQGWFSFVSEIYEQLYEDQPANGEFRRRLIVSLSKSNKIERARKLIAS